MATRHSNLDMLHPILRPAARALATQLEYAYRDRKTRSLFRVFETYRSPERQQEVFASGASKARPWQSAHQHGLAVDFVAVDPAGGWSWDDKEDWAFLKSSAEKLGLAVPIGWDKVHVEHPQFQAMRSVLRR